MKLTLESTTKIVDLESTDNNGKPFGAVPARLWEGQTDSGIPVHAYITRVAVANDQDSTSFERELRECRAPSAVVEAIPARLIL